MVVWLESSPANIIMDIHRPMTIQDTFFLLRHSHQGENV